MRCEGCGKFVSYEGGEEPEIQAEEITRDSDDQATILVSVNLVKNCAECGQPLAQAEFEMEETVDIPEEHRGDDHEVELEVGTAEQTERTQTTTTKRWKRKDGSYGYRQVKITRARYMPHFYGVSVGYTVVCTCGATLDTGTLDEETKAGYLEPVS